ncbi:MAG: peptide transporter permease [Naasia sp.]|uniref:ABC transporter permease n=1 Tax=Naasia sp. TaxID=2546198 RepID=UPI002639C95A|nr:ABC transporter permease [Naasia sp.]MCU1571120.1 peptide transporter permease [Naasia sp.]
MTALMQGPLVALAPPRASRRPLVGGVALALLVVLFYVLPTPYDPNEQLADGLSPIGFPLAPGWTHPFGTDPLGRDELSRAIVGGRLSLLIGVVGSLVATAIGSLVGLLAGSTVGWLSNGLMRFTDIFMAFPYLLLAAALQSVLGPGIGNLLLVVGAVSWVNAARVVTAQVRAESSLDYVAALRTLGVPRWRVLLRHLLPNISPQVMVLFTTGISYTILLEATLSFLGLGIQPPTATWGNMIREGQAYFSSAPWLVLAPGLLLVVVVTAVSLISDAVSDRSSKGLKGFR